MPASGKNEGSAQQGGARKNSRPLVLIALHVILLVYSMSGILSKNASAEPFLSMRFCLFYAGMIAILGLYAVAWQQIIKRLPLTLAFANKAVTVVWGALWGVLLFGEHITVPMVVGGILVIAGVALFGYADARSQLDAQPGSPPDGQPDEQTVEQPDDAGLTRGEG